jgi:hypothetical protein
MRLLRAATLLGLFSGTLCVAPGPAAAAGVPSARPDFSGVWQVAPGSATLRPVGGGEPPLLPAAKQRRDEFRAQLAQGNHAVDPIEQCKPPGNPRTMLESMPFEIMQRPDLVFFGYQWNRLNRFAYWGDTLAPAPGWTFYGNSSVAWDGNTLVIRSHGYQKTGITYLDATGLPSGDKLELTERYTLKNSGKEMQLQLRFDDSENYSRPWNAVVNFNKQAGVHIGDDVCVLRMKLIKTD